MPEPLVVAVDACPTGESEHDRPTRDAVAGQVGELCGHRGVGAPRAAGHPGVGQSGAVLRGHDQGRHVARGRLQTSPPSWRVSRSCSCRRSRTGPGWWPSSRRRPRWRCRVTCCPGSPATCRGRTVTGAPLAAELAVTGTGLARAGQRGCDRLGRAVHGGAVQAEGSRRSMVRVRRPSGAACSAGRRPCRSATTSGGRRSRRWS